MDETAILHAEDSLLKRYGVSAGDIRLKLLCKGSDLNNYNTKRPYKILFQLGKLTGNKIQ